MELKKPSDDLLAALECELLGESSLRVAHSLTPGPTSRKKVGAMRKLETQTKQRILEYFEQNGLEVPSMTAVILKGSILGLLFPLSPWKGILKNTVKETEHYLKIFYRLEEQAKSRDKPLFEYILAHELAIKRFAELELDQKSLDKLRPMTDLLAD